MKKSKRGNKLLGIIVIIIVVIGTPILLLKMNDKKNNDITNNEEYSKITTSNIVLSKYIEGTDKVLNTVKLVDGGKIKELQQINENLKLLPKSDIKLAVAREWQISIEENVIISGNFSEDYCYYFNQEENISKLVRCPENLKDLLNEVL